MAGETIKPTQKHRNNNGNWLYTKAGGINITQVGYYEVSDDRSSVSVYYSGAVIMLHDEEARLFLKFVGDNRHRTES